MHIKEEEEEYVLKVPYWSEMTRFTDCREKGGGGGDRNVNWKERKKERKKQNQRVIMIMLMSDDNVINKDKDQRHRVNCTAK